MGSRGAFIDVNTGNFEFKNGGQLYRTIGVLSGFPDVKVLVQNSKRVKAPEYSHTAERIYAIVKNGVLKHLALYDENHKQAVCIDFGHSHKNICPHKHLYLNHSKNSPGIPPTVEELFLADRIRKEFNLK